jgi:aminopeptidase N
MTLPEDIQIGWGRIANDEGVIVLSSFLPILSVYEPNGWWMDFPDGTGDPAYSDIALWDVTLSAPDDLAVASTGTIVESSTEARTASYHIVSGPVRDFSIALSDEFELDTVTQNGVTVNIWSLQGSASTDQQAVEVAADAVRIFDEEFGAYPYNEMDVVEAPIQAAGIEYPGLIYIATGAWFTGRDSYLDIVIVHEVAHQWWYALVGNNQVDVPWIDEGLTEYSVIVYYTEAVGPNAGREIRDGYQDEVDDYLAGGNDREPVGLPADEYNGYEYRVFVYSAGALFYSYLEDEYGEAAVRAFLRDYFTRFRYDLVENAELERLVEEHFGPEAGDFFTDWVYTGE